MPASSQQRFLGLVRSVQQGKRSISSVGPAAQRAARSMKPADARETIVPVVTKQATGMDLLGLAWLQLKQADAGRLNATVANVAKSVQRLGETRRKQLEKDLNQVRATLSKEQQNRTQLEQKLKEQESQAEDRRLDLEAQAEERRLNMELQADERRHVQQMRHDQQRMEMELAKSQKQSEQEAALQQQEAQLNGQTGPAAPVGQVPYGAMLQTEEDTDTAGKKGKPSPGAKAPTGTPNGNGNRI